MKKHWILNFIMIMMLAGCDLSSSESTPTSDNSREQTITAVEIEMAKTMTEAAVTVTAPFIEDGPAKSQTPSPSDGEQCALNVLELPKSITGVEGKLVLQGRDYSSKNWYLLDIVSGEKIQLPNLSNLYIFDAAVSPNGEWLAYVASNQPYKDDQLFVITAAGKIEEQHSLVPPLTKWPAEGHSRLVGWIDNDRLLVSYGNRPGADAESLVLNPFTGEWQSYLSDYSNLFTTVRTSPFWGKYNVTLAVFQPSLDLLVYPSYEGLVLWDMQKNRAISTYPDDNFLSVNEPVWAQDSSSFVTDLFSSRADPQKFANRNIFQVFPSGKLVQLTSYTNRTAADFVDYSWSPDGNFIAFWMAGGSDESQVNYQLAILDVSSHQVKELCIRAEMGEDNFPRLAPVWSQNSKYITVAAASVNQEEVDQPIIIDLAENTAYMIEADGFPTGWMK